MDFTFFIEEWANCTIAGGVSVFYCHLLMNFILNCPALTGSLRRTYQQSWTKKHRTVLNILLFTHGSQLTKNSEYVRISHLMNNEKLKKIKCFFSKNVRSFMTITVINEVFLVSIEATLPLRKCDYCTFLTPLFLQSLSQ